MIDKSPFEFDEDEDLAELFESGEDMDDKENDMYYYQYLKLSHLRIIHLKLMMSNWIN